MSDRHELDERLAQILARLLVAEVRAGDETAEQEREGEEEQQVGVTAPPAAG